MSTSEPLDRDRPRSWRVVDLVVASVLAVAGGLFLWALSSAYTVLTAPLAFYAPAAAVLAGFWVLPGVLGGLVVRRPGAAVFTELVAALVEALLGNQWGFSTVYYGVLEGLGAEVVLALFLYRRYGLPVALLAGAGAGAALGLLDTTLYYAAYPAGDRAAYVVIAVASGAAVAGGLAWALTGALARSGALAPLASGSAVARV